MHTAAHMFDTQGGESQKISRHLRISPNPSDHLKSAGLYINRPSRVDSHADSMSMILGRVPRSLSVRLAKVGYRQPRAKATSLIRLISQNAVASARSSGLNDLPLAYTWLTRTPGQIVRTALLLITVALTKYFKRHQMTFFRTYPLSQSPSPR